MYMYVHDMYIIYVVRATADAPRPSSTICPLNLDFEIYQKKLILPPAKMAIHIHMPLLDVDS